MAREDLVARFRPAYLRATDALSNLGWLPNLVLLLTVGFMFFSGAVSKLGDLRNSHRCLSAWAFPLRRCSPRLRQWWNLLVVRR